MPKDLNIIKREQHASFGVGVVFILFAFIIGISLVCSGFNGVFDHSEFLVDSEEGASRIKLNESLNNINDNYLLLIVVDVVRRALRAGLIFTVFYIFLDIGKRALMPSIQWNKIGESKAPIESGDVIAGVVDSREKGSSESFAGDAPATASEDPLASAMHERSGEMPTSSAAQPPGKV